MRYRAYKNSSKRRGEAAMSCTGCLILFAILLIPGAFAFDYALDSLLGQDVPWYADAAGGLVTAELVIPVAVVCWILRFFMPHPFF